MSVCLKIGYLSRKVNPHSPIRQTVYITRYDGMMWSWIGWKRNNIIQYRDIERCKQVLYVPLFCGYIHQKRVFWHELETCVFCTGYTRNGAPNLHHAQLSTPAILAVEGQWFMAVDGLQNPWLSFNPANKLFAQCCPSWFLLNFLFTLDISFFACENPQPWIDSNKSMVKEQVWSVFSFPVFS